MAQRQATNKRPKIVNQKLKATLHQFKAGKLYSSSGHKVTQRRQAVAIGLEVGERYESRPHVVRSWGGRKGLRPALKKSWKNVSRKGTVYTVQRRTSHQKSTGSLRAAKARKRK